MFGIESYANPDLAPLMFGVFILIAIFLWSYHWKAAKMSQFAHFKSLDKIADRISKQGKITKRVLSCLVFILLIFAILRPQGYGNHKLDDDKMDAANKEISSSLSLEDLDANGQKNQKVKIRESARDIIFLLDVSASMGAQDIYPDRLSKAKEMIHDIVSALDGEHIGLVIFTSVPSVKCVLTLDYTYFLDILDKVGINDNDFAGTKFTPALSEIINKQFDFSDNENKDLFIITDGGDTDVEGLEGQERSAAENAIFDLSGKAFETKGIRIHTIGLGSKEGTIVQGVKDRKGRMVKSSLNEEFLKNISARAKGINITASNGFVDLKDIYLTRIATEANKEKLREIELNKNRLKELVEKQKEKGEQKIVYRELYNYPLFLAIILLIAEFFISEKKRPKKKSNSNGATGKKIISKTLPVIFLLLLISPLPSHAATDEIKELTSQGNESFNKGDLAQAVKLYDQALEIEARNPIILYNRANVLFKQGKFQEALTIYREALKASPPRHLISDIYYNAGNTAMKLAELQTNDQEGLEELQKAVSHYETSFTMYRKSLAKARAISIAEGRDIEDAGRSARKNWALARELWTTALDKIKSIRKENMTLEDAIRDLLTAQSNLLPTLEGVYLNSLSAEALKFNLKRLAEYQLDYRQDISDLRELATKQEEEAQTKIDNLKSAAPAGKKGSAAANQPTDTPETSELAKKLENAQEINKTVGQAAALDEWIIDDLKKNQAMEAWRNTRKMVDLLTDLSSYLEKSDPVLKSYEIALRQLESTEELLSESRELAKIKDNESAKLALSRRTTLAAGKTAFAGGVLTKINFFLAKIRENRDKSASEPDNVPEKAVNSPTTGAGQSPEHLPTSEGSAANQALEVAIEKIANGYLDELHSRNQKLAETLETKSKEIAAGKDESINDLLTHVQSSLAWFKQLGKPVGQITTELIKDCTTAEDIINNLLETEQTNDRAKASPRENRRLQALPDQEKINILSFMLDGLPALLDDLPKTDPGAERISALKDAIMKGAGELKASWQSEKNLREKLHQQDDYSQLLKSLGDLRLALIKNLLIFSPDLAVNHYFERTGQLLQNLLELLPLRAEIIPTIKKRRTRVMHETTPLEGLLASYLDNLEKSITAMDNQEKKDLYQSSLESRRKAGTFIKRLIKAGHSADSLVVARKFQQAEILFRDLPGSLAKSRLAFAEQPKKADKALTLAIALQKQLENQSRATSEATTVEGEAGKLIPYLSANQDDINILADRASLLLQNQINAADPANDDKRQPPQQTAKPEKVDAGRLKEAIDKVRDAQVKMAKIGGFLKAGEFHNTLGKHQEVIDLLQAALDLLKNKDQKHDKQDENKKDAGKKQQNSKDKQDSKQQQSNAGHGEKQPAKPLELSSREARELLKRLNKQDENQQRKAMPSHNQQQLNTPRPW